jgi:hypothetical protein
MSLLSALAQVAALFTEKAKSKITEVRAPSAIAESFTIDAPTQEGEIASVSVHIRHPATAAYEWGSGIHKERGTPGKYPIPKTPTGVKFSKSKWPQYDPAYYDPPQPAPDVFSFAQVQHPGVAKRPFIKPTLEENKGEFAKLVFGGIRAEIMLRNEKTGEFEVVEVVK